MSTEGKWILVTGHTGAIGRQVSTQLLEAGYSIYGISRSGGNHLEREKGSESLRSCALDLTHLADIPASIRTIHEEVGPLRGFVHCAGTDFMRPLYMTRPENFETLMRIHSIAPLLIVGELMGANRMTEDFSAVLLSSLAVHEGAKGHVAYAAAKGALNGSLKAVASELAGKQARINILSPGIVETELSHEWISRLSAEKQQGLAALYPFGFGKAQEIAKIVAFLISDQSRWITGQEVVADGGRLLN